MVHDGNLGVATETDSSISRALYNRNTPSAPYYPGELNFTVEKVGQVQIVLLHSLNESELRLFSVSVA